jgi:hypothetical protein
MAIDAGMTQSIQREQWRSSSQAAASIDMYGGRSRLWGAVVTAAKLADHNPS